ncbi:MAG TPA: hypothetical protein VFI95_06915 [Terriglobales bacterium]|nr:hypothetical protein [Terriglobales bacterium]
MKYFYQPIIGVLLILAPTMGFAHGAQKPAAHHAPKAIAQAQGALDQEDVAAMKEELQKMRTLLTQMQVNFALVGNTTTPVNHELELNMQMWQLMLDHMQHRLDKAQNASPAANR